MRSTLFASTLAAALTATSFGQVEVQLIEECCESDGWNIVYSNQILLFDTSIDYGYTGWEITVPEARLVSFTLNWISGCCVPEIGNYSGDAGPFDSIINSWLEQGNPDIWTGTFILPAGFYRVDFYEFEGIIDFNAEFDSQGSCCVNTGCSSTGETTCTELGGTWTEGGSCDDCEPVADDCPADVDGDGTIGFSDVLVILNDWGAFP